MFVPILLALAIVVPCDPATWHPDQPAYVLSCAEQVGPIQGNRLYWRERDTFEWILLVDLPCGTRDLETEPGTWASVPWCPLDTIGAPPLRLLNYEPGVVLEYVATAYNSAGESGFSNIAEACYPNFCDPATAPEECTEL